MMDWAHCEMALSGKPLPCLLQFLVFWKRLQDHSGYSECDLRCLSYYFYYQKNLTGWSGDHKEMSPVSVKCSPGTCVTQWNYSLSLSAQMEMVHKTSLHNNIPQRKQTHRWLQATNKKTKSKHKQTPKPNKKKKANKTQTNKQNPEKLQTCNQGSILFLNRNSRLELLLASHESIIYFLKIRCY